MWILFGATVGFIIVSYFLSVKMYMEPKNKEYFNNVKNVNTIKMPQILADPKYILLITFIMGTLIGLFLALANIENANQIYSAIYSIIIVVLYWIEISRQVSITDNSLVLSRALSRRKEIPLDEIKGIYIYSFGKKFMKGHALTTKLVVSTQNERIRFTISSLSKKAILNMIKNNFGVTDYKIFVATNK